ncbi:hypothetical protein B0A50_00751 [Salinomyces thailandicus]|uniref:Uncharacterized protein n=1 Tax=Salinomyces thailandicus TaxID=706561 RepID=A0A4U0UCM8_9PEZI|nr:hypothetical protein B0A50_00751 [Salinomyces thailandica]
MDTTTAAPRHFYNADQPIIESFVEARKIKVVNDFSPTVFNELYAKLNTHNEEYNDGNEDLGKSHQGRNPFLGPRQSCQPGGRSPPRLWRVLCFISDPSMGVPSMCAPSMGAVDPTSPSRRKRSAVELDEASASETPRKKPTAEITAHTMAEGLASQTPRKRSAAKTSTPRRTSASLRKMSRTLTARKASTTGDITNNPFETQKNQWQANCSLHAWATLHDEQSDSSIQRKERRSRRKTPGSKTKGKAADEQPAGEVEQPLEVLEVLSFTRTIIFKVNRLRNGKVELAKII